MKFPVNEDAATQKIVHIYAGFWLVLTPCRGCSQNA